MSFRFEEEDINKIEFHKLDENYLYQHLCKVLIIFDMCFGFRGDKEHAFLTIQEIGNGFFQNNNPRYPVKEWWGLSFIKKDKKATLSLGNVHVCKFQKDFGKFPVLSDEKKV